MGHASSPHSGDVLVILSGIASKLALRIHNPSILRLGLLLMELSQALVLLRGKLGQALDERLNETYEELEKACTWPEYNNCSDLSTLKSLTKRRTWRDLFWLFWTTLFPQSSLQHHIGECLKNYASNSAQFEVLLKVIKEVTEEAISEWGKSHTREQQMLGNPSDRLSSTIPGSEKDKPPPPKLLILCSDSAKTEDTPHEYPMQMNKELHGVLRKYLDSCGCGHSARLRLSPRGNIQKTDAVCFEMLFPTQASLGCSSGIGKWKETKMIIQRQRPDSPNHISQQEFCEALNCSESSLLSFQINPPRLKQINREKVPALKVKSVDSISLAQVLMMHKMPKETRCILAYTLAKSVWQYYSSGWMDYPWTRGSIHILDDQPEGGHFHPSSCSFRPYFAVKFQNEQVESPEYVGEDALVQRYPRILALGILLIEIAKEKRVVVPNRPFDYSPNSINYYYEFARKLLKEGNLFKESDDDPEYLQAVESCLKSTPFADLPYESGNRSPGETDEYLRARQAEIYRGVVCPLRELLVGAGWFSEADKLDRRLKSKAMLEKQKEYASFLSESSKMTSTSWIDELVWISESFSVPDNHQPVRVTVIDTGCDITAPIFDLPGYRNRLKGHWKDWMDESLKPRDDHGHGTEIVSLLLRILPNAEIFVARVAKDVDSLIKAGERIAKAIDHAATEWKSDIVTMSFGFRAEIPEIREAILKAERKRGWSILFFAAAANEGSNSGELFPASLDSVIPMRATDCTGEFVSRYNPNPCPSKGGVLYGTLGKDVPWGWPENKTCSGCSIASPIAAGIATLIIQWVASRPKVFNEEDKQKIRKKETILDVFYRISESQPEGRRYIGPRRLVDGSGKPRLDMIRDSLRLRAH